MTKTTKRAGRPKLAPLLLLGVAMPMLLLGLTAALMGTAAIRQWVPQNAILYLSYVTAVIFYLVGPLPIIAKIGKYPLPVAYGYAVLWTAVFALINGLSNAPSQGSSGILWVLIAVAATVSGILGTKLTRR